MDRKPDTRRANRVNVLIAQVLYRAVGSVVVPRRTAILYWRGRMIFNYTPAIWIAKNH